MKKSVLREVTICDICNKDNAWASFKCLGCAKDLCYKCGVYYSLFGHHDNPSPSDLHYCKECDVALVSDPLHEACVGGKETS